MEYAEDGDLLNHIKKIKNKQKRCKENDIISCII
jgi:hypothetical protein